MIGQQVSIVGSGKRRINKTTGKRMLMPVDAFAGAACGPFGNGYFTVTGQDRMNWGGCCIAPAYTFTFAGITPHAVTSVAGDVSLTDLPNKTVVVASTNVGSGAITDATPGIIADTGTMRLKWQNSYFGNDTQVGCVITQLYPEITFNTPDDSTSGVASVKWIAIVFVHLPPVIYYDSTTGDPTRDLGLIFYGEKVWTPDTDGVYRWDGSTPIVFNRVAYPGDGSVDDVGATLKVLNIGTGGTLTISPGGTPLAVPYHCGDGISNDPTIYCFTPWTATTSDGGTTWSSWTAGTQIAETMADFLAAGNVIGTYIFDGRHGRACSITVWTRDGVRSDAGVCPTAVAPDAVASGAHCPLPDFIADCDTSADSRWDVYDVYICDDGVIYYDVLDEDIAGNDPEVTAIPCVGTNRRDTGWTGTHYLGCATGGSVTSTDYRRIAVIHGGDPSTGVTAP